jgi:hypothetical protein
MNNIYGVLITNDQKNAFGGDFINESGVRLVFFFFSNLDICLVLMAKLWNILSALWFTWDKCY